MVCLCIIALGLIVYFSTNSSSKNDAVNEATTIEETTEVQRAVTGVTETTEKATVKHTEKSTAESSKSTTEKVTMEQGKNNIPYKSYYKYPLTEAAAKGYSEELTYDKTMDDYRAHTAVDFKGEEDDKVVAINDGIVTNVYTDDMYGIVVEVDHGGKLVARYCGLKSASVKKGTYLNIGNAIGVLGTVPCETGDGVHLHFETLLDGKKVNPLDAMSKTE